MHATKLAPLDHESAQVCLEGFTTPKVMVITADGRNGALIRNIKTGQFVQFVDGAPIALDDESVLRLIDPGSVHGR